MLAFIWLGWERWGYKGLEKGRRMPEIYLQGYGRERGVVGTVQGKVRGD